MLIQHSPPLFTQIKVRHLILVYLLASVATITLLIVAKIDPKHLLFLPIGYITVMVTCCGWVLQRCRKFKINSREIIGRVPRNVSWIRLIGLTSAVLLFSIGSALIVMHIVFHLNAGFLESLLKSNQSLKIQPTDLFLKKALTFLTLVVVAPITEEFLFRGIILQRWAEKWSLPTALIASSLLFGFLHPFPIGASMFGLVMGLLYIKTKTLWITIFCHALNNLAAFTAMAYSASKAPNGKNSSAEFLTNLNSASLVGLVVIAISLPFLLRFIRQNFPRRQQHKLTH